MNDEQLSNWSEPGEKPPRRGVWETDYANDESRTFQYFNGREFRAASGFPNVAYEDRKYPSPWCDQSKVRFRGLVNKP